MKKVAVVLALVALFVAPSFAAPTAYLTVDQASLQPGTSTMVHVFVQDPAGVQSAAFNVTPSVAGVVTAAPVTWLAPFALNNLPDSSVGTVTAAGGLSGARASTPVYPFDLTVGANGPQEIAKFQITAGAPGTTVLGLSNITGSVGWVGIVNWASQIGSNYQGVSVTVVPEPMSLALLALGGLGLLRRRMA